MFVSWCLLSSEAKTSGLGGHSTRLTLFSILSCRHHCSTWRRQFLQKLYMPSLHLWHKPGKTRNCIVNTQAPLPTSSTQGGFMAALDADMKWSCCVWQKAIPQPRLSSVLIFLTAQLQAALIFWRAPGIQCLRHLTCNHFLFESTHQLDCCSETHICNSLKSSSIIWFTVACVSVLPLRAVHLFCYRNKKCNSLVCNRTKTRHCISISLLKSPE